MKSKAIVAVTVLVTVAAMIVLSGYGGGGILNSITGGAYKAPNTVTTTTTIVNGVTEKYTGAVNFQVKPVNTINGTALTGGTDFTVQYLQKLGDTYTPLGTETDGTEQMVVGKNDKVYALVKVASGKNYLIDYTQTQTQQNDGTVGQAFYADPLNSGLASYIFPLDMTVVKSKSDPNNVPTYEWYPRFLGTATFAINAPASYTSIGTGQVTKTILWTLTAATQPASVAVKAVQVKVNGTDSTNEVAEEQSFVDIPEVGQPNNVRHVSLAAMTPSVDYSTSATTAGVDRTVGQSIFRYVYTQSVVNGADIITVPSTGSNVVNIPVTITGTTSGSICVQLKVENINARNVAGTSQYDSVELVNGATNTVECTMGGST